MMTLVGRTPENIALRLSLLRQAQIYDQECASWMHSAPEQWQYKTVVWVDHIPQNDYAQAEVFPGRVDIYPGVWAASMWNTMRCSRIFLALIIIRSNYFPEMNTDIIASVPYLLGWHLWQKQAGSGGIDNNNLFEFLSGQPGVVTGFSAIRQSLREAVLLFARDTRLENRNLNGGLIRLHTYLNAMFLDDIVIS